jgi:hypothetical protein
MTPRDFIHSLLPFNPYTEDTKSRVKSAEMFLSLADTNGDGLIDYEEYLLFLTLIATPEYHWKISFKLFDGIGAIAFLMDRKRRWNYITRRVLKASGEEYS